MRLIKFILCVYLILVAVSVAIGLTGMLLGLTFGLLGAIFEILMHILFHPVVIVLAGVFLAYHFFLKAPSK